LILNFPTILTPSFLPTLEPPSLLPHVSASENHSPHVSTSLFCMESFRISALFVIAQFEIESSAASLANCPSSTHRLEFVYSCIMGNTAYLQHICSILTCIALAWEIKDASGSDRLQGMLSLGGKRATAETVSRSVRSHYRYCTHGQMVATSY
jgi:hypothetical protein